MPPTSPPEKAPCFGGRVCLRLSFDSTDLPGEGGDYYYVESAVDVELCGGRATRIRCAPQFQPDAAVQRRYVGLLSLVP